MKKILMCTGEENSFDSDLTMFKYHGNKFQIEHQKMFASETKVNKLLRNLGPFFMNSALSDVMRSDLSDYDVLIIFESIVKNYAIKYIRKKNPNLRIIIYFRNQFSFSKKRNVSLDFLKKLNCEFWSYHMDDCNKLGFKYNNQFWNVEFQKKVPMTKKTSIDCLFLGRIKGRLQNVLGIYDIIRENNLKDFIYLVPRTEYSFDKNIDDKYMSYITYLNKLADSKVVIDLVNSDNYGLTLRPLEALFYKKKVITNYVSIKEYDFYDSQNIFILGEDDESNIVQFINSEFKEIDKKILYKYDFIDWIQHFL